MYSTAKEVHIGIMSKLYQLNSNRKRTIRPEELDNAFNGAMLRFIEERSIVNAADTGLDETVKRQDDLKDLKVSRKSVSIVVDSDTFDTPFESDVKVMAILPNDYYKFEGLELVTSHNCNRKKDTVNLIDVDKKPYIVEFTTPSDASKYDTFTLATSTAFYNTVLAKMTGFKNVESKFAIINSVLNTANFDVYWENFLGDNFNNNFIVYTDKPPVTLLLDGTSTIGTLINDSLKEFEISDSDVSKNELVPTELVASKELIDIRANVYAYRNRHRKPLIELENNVLRIDYNIKYIPIKAYISYIKKPIFINLKGGIMTDFKSHIDEIIDMAAAMLQQTFDGKEGLIRQTLQNAK